MKILSALLFLAAVVTVLAGMAGPGAARGPEARAFIEGMLGAGVAAHFGTGP